MMKRAQIISGAALLVGAGLSAALASGAWADTAPSPSVDVTLETGLSVSPADGSSEVGSSMPEGATELNREVIDTEGQ